RRRGLGGAQGEGRVAARGDLVDRRGDARVGRRRAQVRWERAAFAERRGGREAAEDEGEQGEGERGLHGRRLTRSQSWAIRSVRCPPKIRSAPRPPSRLSSSVVPWRSPPSSGARYFTPRNGSPTGGSARICSQPRTPPASMSWRLETPPGSS